MLQKAENYLPFYYGESLSGDIPFEDFFNLTQKRLTLLKKIEGFDFDMDSKDRTTQINTELRTQGLDGRLSKQEQRNDILSHYFLRIAYSKNKDLRDWFVRQELLVFRARLSQAVNSTANHVNMLVKELMTIQSKFGDSFCPFELVINPAENSDDVKRLKRYESYLEEKGIFLKDGFIKVPFEYIPRLVANRDVLIREGTGYLPFKEGGVLLLETFFKRNLEDVTKKAKKILPLLEEMNGLFSDYLQNIDNLLFNTKDFTKISMQRHSTINIADLDAHANTNYPLCMRQMHIHLKQAHHMKHTGRIQYGLFLKGIGLTLDDSIKFWRTEFTKKIPKEQFDRNYLYNVRHSYGKEGKRADYTPWSCSRIILDSAPGKGEVHGCPFKDYNENNLKRVLMDFKITGQQIDEILEKKRGNHFQMSCKLFFMATHPQAKELEGVGVHPNSYFEASFGYYSQDKGSSGNRWNRGGSAYKGNNNFSQTQNQTQTQTQTQTQSQTQTPTQARGQISQVSNP